MDDAQYGTGTIVIRDVPGVGESKLVINPDAIPNSSIVISEDGFVAWRTEGSESQESFASLYTYVENCSKFKTVRCGFWGKMRIEGPTFRINRYSICILLEPDEI